MQRDPTDCKRCNICQKKCHAHVNFMAATTIRDVDCNHCLDCVVDCPRPNVLSARGPLWRLSHPVYAAMLVGGLFFLVGTSSIAGKWQTKPKLLALTDGKGRLDPESIRGWMTLQEIATGFGIPLDTLYQSSGIPAGVPASARLNTVAKTYKVVFEPDKLRDVVHAFLSGKQPVQALTRPQATVRGTGGQGIHDAERNRSQDRRAEGISDAIHGHSGQAWMPGSRFGNGFTPTASRSRRYVMP